MPFASLKPGKEIESILLTQESNKDFEQNLKFFLEKVKIWQRLDTDETLDCKHYSKQNMIEALWGTYEEKSGEAKILYYKDEVKKAIEGILEGS